MIDSKRKRQKVRKSQAEDLSLTKINQKKKKQKLGKSQVISSPSLTEIDLVEAMKKQNDVSMFLAGKVISTLARNSNLVFSPASMNAVLTMEAATSQSDCVKKDIMTFLRSASIDELNAVFREITAVLLPDGSMSGGPKIATVNGVWIERSRRFSPSCKDLLVNFFKAEFAQVDFRSKAEEIRMEVNKWASHHTNGLIEDLLPLGSVTRSTTQIYGNALYFKGVWQHKFNKSLTKYNDFYLLNGKYVRVPFMTSGQRQYIEAYDGFKVLELPYRQGSDDDTNRKFSMYFYLPDKKDGLHNLVEKMASTHGFLDRHIPSERVIVGAFGIPKFKIEFGFEASQVFGDWKHEMPLYHKACVEIDEEGTEAVAVSARVGYCTSNGIVPKRLDFVADHPFLFLIREDKTGTVLFVGQIFNPCSPA